MRFYLGTHKPQWLAQVDFPLFISRRTLILRRTWPKARAPWAMDSGSFTELSMYGGWTLDAYEYAKQVRIIADQVGKLEWVAPQDWMCEPAILERTGYTVEDHQWRTVTNFLDLRDGEHLQNVIPVLQGWTLADYLRCLEMYEKVGVNLANEPVVGLGTVCRRQATSDISTIVHILGSTIPELHLHGFGVKVSGLQRYGEILASSDSMAWSYDARRRAPLHGCSHRSCANCLRFATRWRERLLNKTEAQQSLTFS